MVTVKDSGQLWLEQGRLQLCCWWVSGKRGLGRPQTGVPLEEQPRVGLCPFVGVGVLFAGGCGC